MMKRVSRPGLLGRAVVVGALVLSACGSDDAAVTTDAPIDSVDDAPVETTAEPADTAAEEVGEEPEDSVVDAPADTAAEPASEEVAGWTIDTSDCVDTEATEALIDGTIVIGTTAPLTGGPATAFAPVIEGMRAFVDFANANDLVPGHDIELLVEDDQYNKDLTPGAVNTMLDDGADVISGLIGTANNLAVRDLLDEECVPQMNAFNGSPSFGIEDGYDWTWIMQLPYDLESRGLLAKAQQDHPDGGTAAVFYNTTETGELYADAWDEFGADFGFDIVTTQTIEAADSAPPTAQVNAIAAEAPDVIMAIPAGAQCPTFLSELANAKAANEGWNPQVFLSSQCASPLTLAAAGDAADGVFYFTTGGVVNVTGDAVTDNPGVADFAAAMDARGSLDLLPSASAGWNAMDLTVAMLAAATEHPDGLSRRTIVETVRNNFSYQPRIVAEGIVYDMNGEEDPYLLDSMLIFEYDAAAGEFAPVTEPFRPLEGLGS